MYFLNPSKFIYYKYNILTGQAVWISENPDLSECRSLWLNSIEMRVKEGESLLSISNELSQVIIISFRNFCDINLIFPNVICNI